MAAGLLVLVGLAGLLAAGWSAAPYYAPFDPRQPCLVEGLCDPAVVDAGQRAGWVRAVLAGVAVLLGVLLAVLARSARPGVREAQAPPARPRRVGPRAAGAGLVAAAVTALGALPLALGTLAAPQLGAAVVAWLFLSQAWVLDWYAAQEGSLARRPRARLAGTVAAAGGGWLAGAAAVALGGAGLLAADGVPVGGVGLLLLALVVVDGLVVGALVGALLVLARRRDGGADGGAAGGAAGGVAVPVQRAPARDRSAAR